MIKFLIYGTILTVVLCCAYFTFPVKKYDIPLSKIYVINLDKSKERLSKISNALESQGLKFERFKAILGLDLPIENEKGKIFYGKDLKSGKEVFRIGEKYKIYCPNITLNYTYKPSQSRVGHPLQAGELGIYCSHYEIMLEVIKNRYKSVLVFEDDALIPANLSTILKKLETSMPNYKKYDIIYLGYGASSDKFIDRIKKVKSIPFSELDKITSYENMNLGSTHAIVYGHNGAAKMIDNLEINKGIDLDLFEKVNTGLINSYKVKNVNIVQDNEAASEIQTMGNRLL